MRIRQDVYADAALPLNHGLLLAAVGLCLPAGAGFAGRSAAVLWGVPDLATTADPVEVLLPAGRRWNAGAGVRVRSLRPGQLLVPRKQWQATGRVDTALDLLRWSPGRPSSVWLRAAGVVELATLPASPTDSPSRPRRPGCVC